MGIPNTSLFKVHMHPVLILTLGFGVNKVHSVIVAPKKSPNAILEKLGNIVIQTCRLVILQ